VAHGYYTKEWIPEHDTVITADFAMTDKVKYSNWAVVGDITLDSMRRPTPKDI